MALCARCDEALMGDEPSTVEAFELTGLLLCESCAEAAFEDAADLPEWGADLDDEIAAIEEADDRRRDNPLEPDFRRLGQ
jgi:hypothetical protein